MGQLPRTILSFGEVLWDLMPDAARLGGAPFNLAYRLNSLGERALLISRLGEDALGQRAHEQGVSIGLDMSGVQWDAEHPTGTVHVTFDEQKSPDYVIVRDAAYDHIAVTSDILKLAGGCDSVCFGTVAQRCETSRRACRELLAASSRAVKLLDLNLRKECYTRETVLESLEHADLVKLNEEEANQVCDLLGQSRGGVADTASWLVRRFALQCCVVTVGEQGAVAVSSSGESARVPGFSVAFADALGAGDAFTAGFLHRYLRGDTLADCCAFGNSMGAMAASRSGATVPICRGEVEALMSSSHDVPSQASSG